MPVKKKRRAIQDSKSLDTRKAHAQFWLLKRLTVDILTKLYTNKVHFHFLVMHILFQVLYLRLKVQLIIVFQLLLKFHPYSLNLKKVKLSLFRVCKSIRT